MIRQTDLYNLPPHQDEDEFLKWRPGEHRSADMPMQGVVASQFHRVLGAAAGRAPAYRFLTTVDRQDQERFERGFCNPQIQVALVSECLIDESDESEAGE